MDAHELGLLGLGILVVSPHNPCDEDCGRFGLRICFYPFFCVHNPSHNPTTILLFAPTTFFGSFFVACFALLGPTALFTQTLLVAILVTILPQS